MTPSESVPGARLPLVPRLLVGVVLLAARAPVLVLAITAVSLFFCVWGAFTRLQYRTQRDEMISPDKECQLRNPNLGPKQCAFVTRDKKVFIRDFDSGHVTLVNGTVIPALHAARDSAAQSSAPIARVDGQDLGATVKVVFTIFPFII